MFMNICERFPYPYEYVYFIYPYHGYVTAFLSTLTFQRTTELKIKDSKMRNKYLNLKKELRKLWKMKVTVILIVIGARRLLFQ